jgi:hypothetical protein
LGNNSAEVERRPKFVGIPTFFGPVLLALASLCSCSRFRPAELQGQVFIVTRAHESVKLGLVEVVAFKRSDVTGAIDATRSTITDEKKRLEALDHQISESAVPWNERDDLRRDLRYRLEYLDSAAPFFAALPASVTTAKTDADGKFQLRLPSSGEFVLAARATRRVGEDFEVYFWLIGVNVNGAATVILSNDNTTDEGSSKESLLHSTSGPNMLGAAENAQRLASKFRELVKNSAPSSGAVATVRATPSPQLPVTLSPAIAATSSTRVLPITPSPNGMPPDPNVVTVTKPVSITVRYGVISLRPGTKLPLVSRSGDKVRVRYSDGTDYDIPVSATDLK